MSKNENKLLRITQMNAVYLDKEIHNALLQLFNESTRNLSPGIIAPFASEIDLAIRLLVLNGSVIAKGCTFGQQLLSLKYEEVSATNKVLYVLGSCLDYVKTKFEIWNPSHNINNVFFNFYVIIHISNFINASVFLRYGVKPLLIERILGLNQVYAEKHIQRQFQSKYLARELVWNGFIEFIVFLLPFINFHKIKRTIKGWNPFHIRSAISLLPTRSMTMFTLCAYCGENPILPHHMGCQHIFCYVCLKGNQTADPHFECPICEHKNSSIVFEKVTVM